MSDSAEGQVRVDYAIPQFLVRDATASAEYYRDRLGFDIQFTWGTPPRFAAVRYGGAVIHLIAATDDAAIHPNRLSAPGITDTYVSVRGVDVLHADLVQRGATIVSVPRTAEYGMREFTVEDSDGYQLCFGEEVE